MRFLAQLMSEAIWHVMFPFWSLIQIIITQPWYDDLADMVGRTFPGMNW
jgi:hypothetical protein